MENISLSEIPAIAEAINEEVLNEPYVLNQLKLMKQGSPDKGRKAYFHHIYFKCKYD
jgi:hypothetical protein